MKDKMFNSRFFILTALTFVAAFVRLLPHPPNFAPIAAMALFGGAYFTNKKFAFIVPLTALFISDMVIGFHYLMPAVYISFALIVVIGFMLKEFKVSNLFVASVSSSVLFFVLTNLAEWAFGVMYPKNMLGLVECFTAAIPFFHNTLLGDLFFVGAMFASFEYAKKRVPALAVK